MSNIGIVGYGFVGRAVDHVFKNNHTVLFNDTNPDLKGKSLEEVVGNSDFIFVCVPTPTKSDGKQNLTYMNRCIKQVVKKGTNETDKIIVIKSTVLPGTTGGYAKKYPKTNFCFSPEFLREKHWEYDSEHPDRIILGTKDDNVLGEVYKLHRSRFPKTPILTCDFGIAEMVKYGSNAYLSKDIIFANELSDLCDALGVDYEGVRKGISGDERIKGPLKVTKERGYGGKCLPKDTKSLQSLFRKLKVECPLLDAVIKRNDEIRKDKDWERIKGAFED